MSVKTFFLVLSSLCLIVGSVLFANSQKISVEDIAQKIIDGDTVWLLSLTEAEKNTLHNTFGRGQNLFHTTILSDTPEPIIAFLTSEGVNINHRDDDGRTPLHHSIDSNTYRATKSLLEQGADMEISNGVMTASEFCSVVLNHMPTHESCVLLKRIQSGG